MKKMQKTFYFRLAAVLFLVILAVIMIFAGRKHIVYLDNKSYQYDGGKLDAMYKVEFLNQDGEIKKLYQRERGELSFLGQINTLTLSVTEKKGGKEVTSKIRFFIPFEKDAVVINVPALLAGRDKSEWMTDFVSLATATSGSTESEQVVLTDDFGLGGTL